MRPTICDRSFYNIFGNKKAEKEICMIKIEVTGNRGEGVLNSVETLVDSLIKNRDTHSIIVCDPDREFHYINADHIDDVNKQNVEQCLKSGLHIVRYGHHGDKANELIEKLVEDLADVSVRAVLQKIILLYTLITKKKENKHGIFCNEISTKNVC